MRLTGALGRSFDPVEFVIGDRLSVQNWARALRSDEPVFLSSAAARERGWMGRPVPPVMYAFFLTLPNSILVDELDFVWGRTLAAEIEVHTGRIAGDDERVTGQSFVDEAYEREGRDGNRRQFLRLRTEFRDEADRIVNRWQLLFIEKVDGPADAALAHDAPAADVPRLILPEPFSPAPVMPDGGRLDGRRIGPLDRLDFARLSVSLDDPNLVHLDDAVGQAAGFPSVIGSGGFILGTLYELGRAWASFDRIQSISMRQLVSYPQGSELVPSGTVTVDDANGTALVAAVVADAGGTTIGTGTITVQL